MQVECPVPIHAYESVTLAHGGGGKLSHRLITELLVPELGNVYLNELHDGARILLPSTRVAMSTDSFVIHPPFFPGGDIGMLAVHGTINDLAMCGARPMYLSLAMILEEGFLLQDLARIVSSIRNACLNSGIHVITGDLKVVEKGKGDSIFINTTGIGEVVTGSDISPLRICAGDKILLSGPIAEHGVAILSTREGLAFETELKSDTVSLWPLVSQVLSAGGYRVHAMRDATRGGIASVLNEMVKSVELGILIEESAIPVREDVQGACEILGLDPLYVANEGKFVAFVAPQSADAVLSAMKEHPLGREACIIGEVVHDRPAVRLRTLLGKTRIVEMLSGEQLPRIC